MLPGTLLNYAAVEFRVFFHSRIYEYLILRLFLMAQLFLGGYNCP